MDAEAILKRFEALAGSRAEWEQAWQVCSDYVLPRSGQYNKTAREVYDSTAPLALSRFTGALESILTPHTQRWHSLTWGRDDLDKSPEASALLEAVTDRLFQARYRPEANFANQMTEAYISLGVHGTAAIYVDDRPGEGLRYQCIPVHELYLAENAYGLVDTVFRLYKLTARQARQEFGEALPDNIAADADDPARMDQEHEFVHAVFPRLDYERGKEDGPNLPVASVHLARAPRAIVREGGFHTMPYAVSRFNVAPGEVYGRSPALDVLTTIIQANVMMKTIVRAGERVVNPPLLLPDTDIISGFTLKSGALNFGGVSMDGKQMVVPLQTGANLPVGLDILERARAVINDAFFITLFQVLVDSPQKTATEVMERAQEKAQLLAPIMWRQQSELLRVIIDREIDVLARGGAFSDLPGLGGEEDEGAGLDVLPRYQTPMARAADTTAAQSIMNSFQAMAAMAQFYPDILGLIKPEEAGRALLKSFSVPGSVVAGHEEYAQGQAAKAQAQEGQEQMAQAQMALGALPAIAETEKKLAQAGQLNGGANVEGV